MNDSPEGRGRGEWTHLEGVDAVNDSPGGRGRGEWTHLESVDAVNGLTWRAWPR